MTDINPINMRIFQFIIPVLLAFLSVSGVYAQNITVKSDSLPIFQKNGKPLIFLPEIDSNEVSLVRSVGSADGNRITLNLPGKVKTREALFEKIGTGFADTLRVFLKLKSDADLWSYFDAHSNLADYGIFSFDLRLMSALGRVITDETLTNEKKGTFVYYHLVFKKNTQVTYSGRFVVGAPIIMPKPRAAGHHQADTVLSIKWACLKKTDSGTPFAARLYLKHEDDHGFVQRNVPVYLSLVKDSLLFDVKMTVAPRKFYACYIKLVDLLGNESLVASDTVSVYTADTRPLPLVKNLSSVDTVDGIFLKWEQLNTDQSITGLVIERSATKQGKYKVIDTVSASSTSFTDKNVPDGKGFYYQAYYIGAVKAPKSSFIPFTFNTHVNRKPLFAPYGVNVSAVPNKITVNWQGVEGAAGYYVYRGATSDTSKLTCISPLLADTATQFTDLASKLSRRQDYYYAVRACNLNGKPGNISALVTARPITTVEKVTVPAGPELAVVDSTMHLSWPDLKIVDPYVSGYNVYRGIISAAVPKIDSELPAATQASKIHFEKLNSTPVRGTTFVDQKWTDLGKYCYAISAVDIDEFESGLSIAISAAPFSSVATQFSPPNIIIKKMTKGGNELRWAKVAGLRADARLVIYRRSSVGGKSVEIGKVYGYMVSFVDASAKPGQVYHYQLALAK